MLIWPCCILSKFYIKPQRGICRLDALHVVSYRNSTSNHNSVPIAWSVLKLYLIEILHQTTTWKSFIVCNLVLYLIEILHQTTTRRTQKRRKCSCILSKFYIKPQHGNHSSFATSVVSYRNSTSNHNGAWWQSRSCWLYLIEILHQTTTVNNVNNNIGGLYLIEILHQTTTYNILLYSLLELYLIEILHQTTTLPAASLSAVCCILSKFYIKPQLYTASAFFPLCCILSKFYIKPQRRASY